MSFLPPETRKYLFQTLDPLHVGTGGTRLGRVDNTVARDPATRLPKVPGSGLSGAVKDAYDLKLCNNGKTTRCAGTSGCGREDCKVCTLFGTAPSDETASVNGGNTAHRGIMAFYDARLVAMPVASLLGPVWVVDQNFAIRLGLMKGELIGLPNPDVAAPSKLKVWEGKVNMGSFLFPCNSALSYEDSTIESLTKKIEFFTSSGAAADDFNKITTNMVACHPSVFPLIVDTAMEVRTSVTIDPDTGAAKPQALFTLEAVPSGAVFESDLNFLGGKYPEKAFKEGDNTAAHLFTAIEQDAFDYLRITGMGGNVTRGFGRVRFLGRWK